MLIGDVDGLFDLFIRKDEMNRIKGKKDVIGSGTTE